MSIWKTPYEVMRLLTEVETVAFGLSTIPAIVLMRMDLMAITDSIDITSDEFVACVDAMAAAGILLLNRPAEVKSGLVVR